MGFTDRLRTHHVHVFESGNREIERHKLFVEYMNSHPNKAREYLRLKEMLCFQFSEDPKSYTNGKSYFIKSVDSEAHSWKCS